MKRLLIALLTMSMLALSVSADASKQRVTKRQLKAELAAIKAQVEELESRPMFQVPRRRDWPKPRFTDNGDGTVTDHLTGFMWMRDIGCITAETWEEAASLWKQLNDGLFECGGGYVAGTYNDWRRASLKILYTLVDHRFQGPALSDAKGTRQYKSGSWPFDGDPWFGLRQAHCGPWHCYGTTELNEYLLTSSTPPGFPDGDPRATTRPDIRYAIDIHTGTVLIREFWGFAASFAGELVYAYEPYRVWLFRKIK